MQKSKPKKKIHPASRQRKPGLEFKMESQPPVFEEYSTGPVQKLSGKVALITGGDSGIGRAIAVLFAKHGAHIAINYLKSEEKDAKLTKNFVEATGQKCFLIPGDLTSEKQCIGIVKRTVAEFKKLDVLINNAAIHYSKDSLTEITSKQLHETFAVNVFAMFYLTKEALKYLSEGSCIINTSSVTAYRGSAHLIDYSATKGAIISFTRALSASLVDKKIRVNAVAPGPVWTPLIVSTLDKKAISTFGSDCPMGRAAEPYEIATAFLFLASSDASFITGQVIHPNGGEIVNG